MFRNYANMNIETLVSSVLETMPIQQISFSSIQEFLGPDSIGKVNKMKDIASALGRDRCYFCSYHKAPLHFLQNVKLTGTKDDVSAIKKLPKASFYVPDFVYHPSCHIVQMQGIKTLCKSCYAFHSSMIKTIVMDKKPYTESSEYRHILLPLAKERNVETTVLADILEEKAERLMDLSGSELTWDITYLYNRGLSDERSIFFKPSEDEALENEVDSLEAKKRKILAQKKAAKKNNQSKVSSSGQKAKTKSGKKSDLGAAGWLEKHLSGQNPEYKVYGEIADDAINDTYDEQINSRDLSKDSDRKKSDAQNERLEADYDADDENETSKSDEQLRKEAGETKKRGPIRRSSGENNKAKNKESGKSGNDRYTSKDDEPDLRGVPGLDDES
jgi:hypothetical protein